jgi:hypothetical protein
MSTPALLAAERDVAISNTPHNHAFTARPEASDRDRILPRLPVSIGQSREAWSPGQRIRDDSPGDSLPGGPSAPRHDSNDTGQRRARHAELPQRTSRPLWRRCLTEISRSGQSAQRGPSVKINPDILSSGHPRIGLDSEPSDCRRPGSGDGEARCRACNRCIHLCLVAPAAGGT